MVVLSSPITAPLASAVLKLVRAREHMDPLRNQIRRFEMSQPYRIVRETDHEAGEYIAYAVINHAPGDEWYGPFGDVINNLHSALDHAVFGLSEYFEGRRLTETEAQSVYFPVITDPAKWDAFVKVKQPAIRFLPKPYREVIEYEQPHAGGNDYIRTSHPMHVLHALWNVDKHRQIPFFAGFGRVVHVSVTRYPGPPHRITPPVVDNGSQVVRVPIGAVESEEDFEPVVLVEVTLGEGGPPRNPVSGDRPPIGGFLGYMDVRVWDVVNSLNDLLYRGVR